MPDYPNPTGLAKKDLKDLALSLEFWEGKIEGAIAGFRAIGEALFEIREGAAYRVTHGTFEGYCRDRWGLRERHAYRMIDASKVVENLRSCPIGQLPDKEAQVRPLTALRADDGEMDPASQCEAWAEAVEVSGGRPTARVVAEVVARRLGGDLPARAAPDPVAPILQRISTLGVPDLERLRGAIDALIEQKER
jgi:hypothetical protein